MGYSYEIKNYYKVKEDGSYPWPCQMDKDRTIELFTDDVLVKQENGTYIKHTGLCCFGIILTPKQVKRVKEKTVLQII